MAKDKILICDQSDLLKDFLKGKLEQYGFEVAFARDGFDALIKMKNIIPDLVIIDYFLTQNNKQSFFEEKQSYKTISDIPIIMLSNKVDKNTIMSVAKYKVTKFFSKPIKIDQLLKSVMEILKIDLEIDQTPSQIDIHLNDDILFIEVASGLNIDKIESMKYKIKEIKDLYGINTPKILIIIVDVKINETDIEKFNLFLNIITRFANPHQKAIKILTSVKNIEEIVKNNQKYNHIEVTDDINHALDKLSSVKMEDLINKGWQKSEEDIVFWSNTDSNIDIYETKKYTDKKIQIAIVDDDEQILDLIRMVLTNPNWEIITFKNGKDFVSSLDKMEELPDLLFLDLMMPHMNGFEVLEYMKRNKNNIYTIIFSALSQKETVKKVLMYGVKSYIVKPVTPDVLLKKATEILRSNF